MFKRSNTAAWWEPKDIYFSLEQVKWLISILPLLREGRWQPKPHEGVYRFSVSGSQSKADHAPFESPAMIAAEMDARLKSCGADGWLVKTVFALDEDEHSVGLESHDFRRRVSRCLSYLCGWRRKASPYRDWAKQTDYRRKKILAGSSDRGL
jgi:hypothetical protein